MAGHGARNVSFDIRKGEIRAIIGPNGAGKSSMLNVINGFYQAQEAQSPTRAGPTATCARMRRRSGIGRTFQNIALFKGMTTLDNIMTGRILKMRARSWRTGGLHRPRQARGAAHRRFVEEIIDFLEIQAIRNTRSASCPTACRSGSSSAARLP